MNAKEIGSAILSNAKKQWLAFTFLVGAVVFGITTYRNINDYIHEKAQKEVAIEIKIYEEKDAKIRANLIDSLARKYDKEISFLKEELRKERKRTNILVDALVEEMDAHSYETKYGKVIIEQTNNGDYWYATLYKSKSGPDWDIKTVWAAIWKKKDQAFGYYGWGGADDFIWIKKE